MLNRKKMQRFYKVTVYFKSGTKSYTLSPDAFKKFLKEMKKRPDVIKYTTENTYKYIS